MAEQDEFDNDYDKDLKNFCEIEEDLETNLIKRIKQEDDVFGKDEIEGLNRRIPPYEKGTSSITCSSAISLINRCVHIPNDINSDCSFFLL